MSTSRDNKRARDNRYRRSDKGRARDRRYTRSAKGRERHQRHRNKTYWLDTFEKFPELVERGYPTEVKLARVYLGGSTPGERSAARGRLDALLERQGKPWLVDSILRAALREITVRREDQRELNP